MIRLAIVCLLFMSAIVGLALLIQWLIWRKLPKLREIIWLWLMAWTVMFLVFAWNLRAGACELPDYPPHRAATKALMGDYGVLEPWQRNAYEHLLAQTGNPTGTAYITHYTPREGFYRGKAVRWGQGSSERVAAAIMIDRAWYGGLTLPERSGRHLDMSRDVWTGDYIMVELPGGWQVRQVLDTGAMWNLPKARRKGCDIWLDLWTDDEGLRNVSYQVPYVVIRAYKTW